MFRPARFVAMALAWTAGVAGCQTFMNQLTVDSTAPVLRLASASMDAESDVQLAREALPGNIKTVDGFLAASPEQPELLEMTAMGYSQYAFGFLEDDLESLPQADVPRRQALIDRCSGLYERTFDMGLRLVALRAKNFPAVARRGTQADLETALGKLKKDSAVGLLWAGLGLASVINLHRDDIDRVAELPKAIALLERSRALDPSYYVHAATLTLAATYATQGKAAGGDPDRAAKLFAEVMTATGGRYLMAKVLFARYYGTVTLDRELYEKNLREVVTAPPDIWPEQRLANELARIRAKRYLADADNLF